MTTPTVDSALDERIRAAEDSTFGAYGVHRREEYVQLDTALGRFRVRLHHFGPAGTPGPPIVLLHGVGSMQALAAPLLPYLSDRSVIAVDWPGHGLSGACLLPPGAQLRPFAVSVLDALLSEIGEHQVDLVGHSLGAQFGIYAALDLRANIRRLALLGAPGAALAGAKPATMMKLMAVPKVGSLLLRRKLTDEAFVKLNEDYILGPGAFDKTPAELATVGALLASRPGNAESVATYFRTLIRGNRVREGIAVETSELAGLRAPTLFGWGDADVFLTPAAASSAIVAFRDARLIRVPNAGHAPWLTDPKVVGRALVEHLAI